MYFSTSSGDSVLTLDALQQGIDNNAELWGLLQPHQHLMSGRNASGRPFFTSMQKAHLAQPAFGKCLHGGIRPGDAGSKTCGCGVRECPVPVTLRETHSGVEPTALLCRFLAWHFHCGFYKPTEFSSLHPTPEKPPVECLSWSIAPDHSSSLTTHHGVSLGGGMCVLSTQWTYDTLKPTQYPGHVQDFFLKRPQLLLV